MKAYNEEKIESNLVNLRYRNMPNTRRAAINYVFSNEELIEWAKCYNDPVYFIETYCSTYIQGKIGKIVLREYQKNILSHFKENRFPLYFHSKQMGISLIFSLLYLHYLLFNNNKMIYIFSPKYEMRFEFLNQIKLIYVGLPFFLKKGITKWDDNNLAFENDCKIICSNTKNIENALKIFEQQNQKINIFHIMDMAYFNNDIIRKSYLSIMPYIANNNSRLIINSTAKKEATFLADLIEHSELPKDAPDKSVFETLRIYWWQLNRDKGWVKNTIDAHGEEDFNLEFNLRFF